MITEKELKQRRLKYRAVQLALLLTTIGVVAVFVTSRRTPRSGNVRIETEAPAAEVLAAGDVQVFNIDSTVDLILKDDRILAGLSPKTVAKVRGELARSGADDTSSLGGAIAAMVKEQVADKIGTHVVYDVRDIRDIRYENERIVIDWKSGKETRLFGTIKSDGRGDANRFRPADAQRFIEAVKARQREIP